jgi:hypothetical protein
MEDPIGLQHDLRLDLPRSRAHPDLQAAERRDGRVVPRAVSGGEPTLQQDDHVHLAGHCCGAVALTSRGKRATLGVMNESSAGWTTLPGYEIVDPGVRDLWRGERTVEALMVAICADRLRAVGVGLPPSLPPDPVDAVHGLLDRQVGDEAHGRYNALLHRMLSFLDAVEGSVG